MIKEACVENFSEALAVQQRGANRIELCDNLIVGGTTPSYGTIQQSVEKLEIPVFPIIRPRGGNFVYSDDEINIMKTDIKICKQLGVPGIVLGILTPENKINIEQTKELVELARPMQVTFHKAFDVTLNPFEALEAVIETSADRLLTSGTKPTAEEGIEMLNQLIEQAQGRIKIVVAGKVTHENLPHLATIIHADEFHGKKIV